MHRLLALAALLVSIPARAVEIDWVVVGDPNNPADTPSTNCVAAADCGSVDHDYDIARYETTNAQYAEFLSAKATADPLGLYNPSMGSDGNFGGIRKIGESGSYTYLVLIGFANKPVTYVSYYDSLRFANWLNNGQGSGDTETGAYTLLGGTPVPSNDATVARNAGANIVLASENEWYKAAYYSGDGIYFDYPTGTNSETGCVLPASGTGNSANCDHAVDALTEVGAYGLAGSPYGTFDQGGNVWEWNELIVGDSFRAFRGGSWSDMPNSLAASSPNVVAGTHERDYIGFRVVRLAPEPDAGLLGMTVVLGLAASRRRRAGQIGPARE